jgi:hypothetical protein
MRMNFFVFLFLVFLIIPFVIISCTRSLTALIRPIPQRYARTVEPTRPISPTPTSPTGPTLTGSPMTGSPTNPTRPVPTSGGEGRCNEGCCFCGAKPVGHLFILHDRSYRLCRQHLSRVPQLIEDARRRLVNPFITLTLYDPDLIVAVAQSVK